MRINGLTDAQKVFVRELIETGSRKAAEKISGLSAFDVLAQPRVALAARDRLAARILSVAPLALRSLEALLLDENVPAAVRRLAAADVLDRAGCIPVPPDLREARESLADMPAKSLRELVSRLEQELFARSTPVLALEIQGSAENGAEIDAKPLSCLD